MCGLWPTAGAYSQQEEKSEKTKNEKQNGGKIVRKLLEDDELDRGEELPMNAFLS